MNCLGTARSRRTVPWRWILGLDHWREGNPNTNEREKESVHAFLTMHGFLLFGDLICRSQGKMAGRIGMGNTRAIVVVVGLLGAGCSSLQLKSSPPKPIASKPPESAIVLSEPVTVNDKGAANVFLPGNIDRFMRIGVAIILKLRIRSWSTMWRVSDTTADSTSRAGRPSQHNGTSLGQAERRWVVLRKSPNTLSFTDC